MSMQEMIFGQNTRFWHVETLNWPICQYRSLYHDREGRLSLDAPYQRGLVWPREFQEKLLDSLITGLGVPGVYIRLKKNYTYEVIDGKQRIHTLVSFMDDEWPYRGKLFSEHDEDSQRSLEHTTLPCSLLKFISDEEAVEIYNRINYNGVPHEKPVSKEDPPGFMKHSHPYSNVNKEESGYEKNKDFWRKGSIPPGIEKAKRINGRKVA